ncbi:MAG: ABC transporter permease, partial [Clostridiales bacterium]|nr:ABC transporter permease [Clostridiales bacterium]
MSEHRPYPEIPASDFAFVSMEGRLHDKQLETKPIGYFRDVLIRFSRNRSSVVAAVIIVVLVLYAILAPILARNSYTRSLTDTMYLNYAKLPPKYAPLAFLGLDGMRDVTLNSATYLTYRAIGEETGLDPIVDIYREDYKDPTASAKATFYDIRVDEYYRMGMMYLTLTPAEFEALQAWQDQTGVQVIYPAITDAKQTDANVWYKTDRKGVPSMDRQGNFQPIYRTTTPEDTAYRSLRVAGDMDREKPYAYARVTGTSASRSYVTRVCRYTYFQYRYGMEPAFVFGTNALGQDIFTRLAAGARLSLMLAIAISIINLFIGAFYGAVEGYYGGAIDMFMERVSDILAGAPFIVVVTLFKLHLANKVGAIPSLLFAFVLTGWIGIASNVRMQFYRFKGQEYILAARSLGAKDGRLMFKHIFPNSLGTLITASVLIIPGVIFSESMLSYLGIVNLDSSTMTSVGTMLANGQAYLSTDPYIILFPALFISL